MGPSKEIKPTTIARYNQVLNVVNNQLDPNTYTSDSVLSSSLSSQNVFWANKIIRVKNINDQSNDSYERKTYYALNRTVGLKKSCATRIQSTSITQLNDEIHQSRILDPSVYNNSDETLKALLNEQHQQTKGNFDHLSISTCRWDDTSSKEEVPIHYAKKYEQVLKDGNII